jgi:hypothetical protein
VNPIWINPSGRPSYTDAEQRIYNQAHIVLPLIRLFASGVRRALTAGAEAPTAFSYAQLANDFD